MVGEQDGTQLGEFRRRVFERREHDGALVELEREQRYVFGERALEVGFLIENKEAARATAHRNSSDSA